MHKCWFLRGGSAGTFSLPPNSIHSCAAVKLGSEETEEKSIRVSVWPLIFSLLPSFSPHLHHPISPSLLLLLSQLVRGGQSILTPSTGQVRTSNIPWIHTSSPSPGACTQVTAPPTHPLIRSVFPLLQPHINLTILSFSPFTLSTLSLHCEMFDAWIFLCPFALSTPLLLFPL